MSSSSPLKEHSYLGEKLGFSNTNYEWNIRENDYYITGDMYIDNFDMYNFMKNIGIDLGQVTWGEHPFDISKMPSPSELENQDNWREILHNKRKKFFPKK